MGVPTSPACRSGDAQLVGAVRAGDEAAFAEIYDRHAAELMSFCRHMLGSGDDAEDALQQTFWKAYRGLQRNRDAIAIRPWLYAIARNECISLIRRRRPPAAQPVATEPQGVPLAQTVEGREELAALLSDLARLPDEQREALLLSGLDTLSGEEIAERLATDRDRVKALVFRARRSLASAREAREVSCAEIRDQLAVLRGGSLRRKVLREHLLACVGCQDFRNDVRRQRQLGAEGGSAEELEHAGRRELAAA